MRTLVRRDSNGVNDKQERGGSGEYDPGIRGKIFGPMFINDAGFREMNKHYISASQEVKCDTEWSEEVFHNFDDYVR